MVQKPQRSSQRTSSVAASARQMCSERNKKGTNPHQQPTKNIDRIFWKPAALRIKLQGYCVKQYLLIFVHGVTLVLLCKMFHNTSRCRKKRTAGNSSKLRRKKFNSCVHSFSFLVWTLMGFHTIHISTNQNTKRGGAMSS